MDGHADILFLSDANGGTVRHIDFDPSSPQTAPAPVDLFAVDGGGVARSLSVAVNGPAYLVAYVNQTGNNPAVVHLSEFLPAGGTGAWIFTSDVTASSGPVTADQGTPSVVAGPGQTGLVAWVDQRNGRPDVYGRGFNSGSSFFAPEALVRAETGSPYTVVPFAGVETLADGGGLEARVAILEQSSAGSQVVIEAFQYLSATPQPFVLDVQPSTTGPIDSAAAAWANVNSATGQIAALTWISSLDAQGDNTGVFVESIGNSGNLDGGTQLASIATVAHDSVALASDGTQSLVVWSEYSGPDGGSDVLSRMLGRDGGFVGPVVPIVTGAGNQMEPQVAWGGSGYFVVWTDDRDPLNGQDIWGATVSADGQTVGAPAPLVALVNEQAVPRIAPHAGGYLVTYESYNKRAAGTNYVLWGVRVASNGTALDADGGFTLSTSAITSEAALAAVDGGTWVIATATNGRTVGAGSALIASLVQGGAPSPQIVIDAADSGQAAASFAPGTGAVTLAWVRHTSTANGDDLFIGTLDSTGTVTKQPFEADLGSSTQPQLGFDGHNTVMTWSYVPTDGGTSVLRGQWLFGDGGVGDSFGSASGDYQFNSALAATSGSAVPVGFIHFDPVLAATRAIVFTAQLTGLGQTCASNSDCGSGFCVGALCCDRACDGDCEVCFADAGTQPDGTCGPKKLDTLCRPSNATCDAPEVCDGIHGICPPDGVQPPDHVCNAAIGPCDVAEH